MKRRATAVATLLALATLAGCGGGSGDQTSGGGDRACLTEIKRQISTGNQTESVPPQCRGISDARLTELGKIAIADGFLGPSASPTP